MEANNCGADVSLFKSIDKIEKAVNAVKLHDGVLQGSMPDQAPQYDSFQFRTNQPGKAKAQAWVEQFKAAEHSPSVRKQAHAGPVRNYQRPSLFRTDAASARDNDDEFANSARALYEQLSSENDEKLINSRFLSYLKSAAHIGSDGEARSCHAFQNIDKDEWAEWNAMERDWTTKQTTGYGYVDPSILETQYERIAQVAAENLAPSSIVAEIISLEARLVSDHDWLSIGELSALNEDDFNAIAAFKIASRSIPDAFVSLAASLLNQSHVPEAIWAVSEWAKLKTAGELASDCSDIHGRAKEIISLSKQFPELSSVRARCILYNCINQPGEVVNELENMHTLNVHAVYQTVFRSLIY